MTRVNEQFLDKIVHKYLYDENPQFTEDELIDCYYIDRCSKKYIACYNSGGDAFVEEYDTYEEMMNDCM